MPAPATDGSDIVAVELRRVVERWQQLPLDDALARMPVARVVVQSLADAVAASDGRERMEVPDLGPAVVMDQLTVMVHDAGQTALSDRAADALTRLRKDLA